VSALADEGRDYDGASDYGRFTRLSAFLTALFSRVKGSFDNPLKMNGFLTNLPQGITIDSTFQFNEIIGLALKLHSMSSSGIPTFTLPTISGNLGDVDVPFIKQPHAQQHLIQVFGREFLKPTSPPLFDSSGDTPSPPVVTTTTSTTVKSAAVTAPAQFSTSMHLLSDVQDAAGPLTTMDNPYPYNPIP
jgi:anionic cell wall polymer biosynthesis LytR-Cps2A-Psr (LCP) family protein